MTEKQLLKQLEKKLEAEYNNLDIEAQKEIEEFLEKYETAGSKEKKRLSEEEYQKWQKKFILYSTASSALIKKLSQISSKKNEKTAKIINEYMPKAYNTGAREWAKGFNASFAKNVKIPDVKAIERASKKNQLLPKPRVDIPKDLKWNERKIKSALLQSILKGESNPKLAKRLREAVGMNKTSSIRNARTMMTASHNMGKQTFAEEAVEMGIKVKKMWIATNDDITRDSHAEMDGVVVEVNEPFILTNMDGSKCELMYPADPDGDPEQIYNCRCTMGYVIE